MHPRLLIAAGDDFGLGGGQFFKPRVNEFLGAEELGQPNVSAVVPGLALEQIIVERSLANDLVGARAAARTARTNGLQSSQRRAIDRSPSAALASRRVR